MQQPEYLYPHTTEALTGPDYGMEEYGSSLEVRRMTPQQVAYCAWKILRDNWEWYDGDAVEELVANAVSRLSEEERGEFDQEMLGLEHEYLEEFGEDA